MPMYHWRSDLMAEYRTGYIVVEALNVEEARVAARAHFESDWLANHSYLDPDYEDDREVIEAKRRLLEADIEPEPTEHKVLFILGGE